MAWRTSPGSNLKEQADVRLLIYLVKSPVQSGVLLSQTVWLLGRGGQNSHFDCGPRRGRWRRDGAPPTCAIVDVLHILAVLATASS